MKQLFKMVTLNQAGPLNTYVTRNSKLTYYSVYQLQRLFGKQLTHLIAEYNEENHNDIGKDHYLNRSYISNNIFKKMGKTPWDIHCLKMCDMWNLYGYDWGRYTDNFGNPFAKMYEHLILSDELDNKYISTQIAQVFAHGTEYAEFFDNHASFKYAEREKDVIVPLHFDIDVYEFRRTFKTNRLFFVNLEKIEEKFKINVDREKTFCDFNLNKIAKEINRFCGISDDNPETYDKYHALKSYLWFSEIKPNKHNGNDVYRDNNGNTNYIHIELLTLLFDQLPSSFVSQVTSYIDMLRDLMYDDFTGTEYDKFPEYKFNGVNSLQTWLNLRAEKPFSLVRSNDKLHITLVQDNEIFNKTVSFNGWESFTVDQAKQILSLINDHGKFVSPQTLHKCVKFTLPSFNDVNEVKIVQTDKEDSYIFIKKDLNKEWVEATPKDFYDFLDSDKVSIHEPGNFYVYKIKYTVNGVDLYETHNLPYKGVYENYLKCRGNKNANRWDKSYIHPVKLSGPVDSINKTHIHN